MPDNPEPVGCVRCGNANATETAYGALCTGHAIAQGLADERRETYAHLTGGMFGFDETVDGPWDDE